MVMLFVICINLALFAMCAIIQVYKIKHPLDPSHSMNEGKQIQTCTQKLKFMHNHSNSNIHSLRTL